MKQGIVVQTGDFDFLVEQVNRNKRNVCLDLKHAESRPVLDASSPGLTSSSPTSCRRCAGSSASNRPTCSRSIRA